MRDALSHSEVLTLIDATQDQREQASIDADSIRAQTQAVIQQAEALLDLAYDLTYLEATLHCDGFHEGKRAFKSLNQTYGYITSFVRREGKSASNTYYFSYRRPAAAGTTVFKNLTKFKQGYTERSFRGAAHQYELNLAMLTETHYARLRKQGKTIRSAIRKLKLIDIIRVVER